MVVVLEVPRVLAGGCVTGRERGIRRGRGEERRVRGCKALVEPPGVGWAGAAGGLSGAAAERMCAAGAVDGAIRRDGPRATSSRPIAARTAGVSACVRGGVGGVSRVPGSVSVLASRRRRVAGGWRALPGQPGVPFFFREHDQHTKGHHRVCKHAARLRAARKIEYVSMSTSGHVRRFRRVCMPAGTRVSAGGEHVLQLCCGCRVVCTSALSWTFFWWFMHDFDL